MPFSQNYLNPLTNQEMASFIQYLEANPKAAQEASDALSPPGKPSTTSMLLDKALVATLTPVVASVSDFVLDNTSFKNICWTVQEGAAPQRESVQPANGNWQVTTMNPQGGVVFQKISFTVKKIHNRSI